MDIYIIHLNRLSSSGATVEQTSIHRLTKILIFLLVSPKSGKQDLIKTEINKELSVFDVKVFSFHQPYTHLSRAKFERDSLYFRQYSLLA